jgi:hypothetical protein
MRVGLSLPRRSAGDRAQQACFALLALTVLLHLAVEEGLPVRIYSTVRALACLATVASATLAGARERWLDKWRAVLVLVALWLFPSVYARLGGDGYEYYVLLRSPIVDGDLDFANDFQGLGSRGVTTASGSLTSRVPAGVAIFWAPLFLATHAVLSVAAALGLSVHADGFSGAYQSSATTSSFLCGVLALVLIERELRRHFLPSISMLAVLGIWLGTPLYFYTVANPFMSHAVATLATTLFLLAWLRARHGEDRGAWLLVGAAGGLMFLVRAPSAVLLVLPLASILAKRGHRMRLALAFGLPALVVALFQLCVWRAVHGADFVGHVSTMNLIGQSMPHVLEMLLSPRKGLFVWTPLYLIAVGGWAGWVRRDAGLAAFLIAGFAVATVVNSCFDDWWGSDSFGQRRLLDLTPFYALGLAAALDTFRRRPLVPMTAFLVGVVAWNFQFAYIYNSDIAGPKGGAINLDRLASAQVDASYRRLLRWADHLPAPVWAGLYDIVKGVWLDEGGRSLRGKVDFGVNEAPGDLPMLIGEGWFEPERGDGMIFRPTRGPRSRLLIPIRTIADFDAVLHARLEFLDVPVDLVLKVNNEVAGRVRLQPGWYEYRFFIEAAFLRPGLNAFALVYSATPRQIVPGFDGRNTVLAVDSLTLKRRPPGTSDGAHIHRTAHSY